MKPLPLTSDLEFLRRLSIERHGTDSHSGRNPRVSEGARSHAPRARHRRLLASPSWADNWVSYWQDVLAEIRAILKPDLNNTGPIPLVAASVRSRTTFQRPASPPSCSADGWQLRAGRAGCLRAGHAQRLAHGGKGRYYRGSIPRAEARVRALSRCPRSILISRRTCSASARMLNGKAAQLPVTSTVPLVPGRRVPAVKISLKPGESIDPEWPFQNLIDHAESGALPGSSSKPSRHVLAALVVAPETAASRRSS